MLAGNDMPAISLAKGRLLQMRHFVANGANEAVRAFGLQPFRRVNIKADDLGFEVDITFDKSLRVRNPLPLDKAQL